MPKASTLWFRCDNLKIGSKEHFKLNSNEKEGTTNDISLSLDLINVKDGQNFYASVSKPRFSVLGCLRQYNLNETSNYIVIFFPNSALRNRGCGLCMDAAYTRTFTLCPQQ